MNRRTLLKGAALGTSAWLLGPAFSMGAVREEVATRLAALERRHGGRLGVAILDTGNGRRIDHRADERFAMCSTSKLLVVAAVLSRVDQGEERLDRRVVFGKDKLLTTYSPLTSLYLGAPGMTLAQLCQAAIVVSDNTAANLLIDSLGGPSAVTAYARSLGDELTRLDRNEPDLNEARPGDPRDTTTPAAMLADLQALSLGTRLSGTSRGLLLGWLRAGATGFYRVRAGLPAEWDAGDKTGSGGHNTANDVAILFPAQGKPLLATAYYTGSSASGTERDAVLAEVGRIAASLRGSPLS